MKRLVLFAMVMALAVAGRRVRAGEGRLLWHWALDTAKSDQARRRRRRTRHGRRADDDQADGNRLLDHPHRARTAR